MHRFWLGMVCLALGGNPAAAQGPAGAPADRGPIDPPGIRATQLAVSYERNGGEVRFRATVIEKREQLLTILTAAHCLGPDDRKRSLRLAQGEAVIEGEVLAVVRNPSYGSIPDGEIPGADNALALVRVPAESPLLANIQPALIADDPVPDAQVIPIYAIDQFEKPHAVKAGNFANPKWLQWGDVYRPIPGDSGSGVFAYRRDPDGRPEPFLVGVVTDRDRLGGGASIVSRRQRWLAQTLAEVERELQSIEKR